MLEKLILAYLIFGVLYYLYDVITSFNGFLKEMPTLFPALMVWPTIACVAIVVALVIALPIATVTWPLAVYRKIKRNNAPD